MPIFSWRFGVEEGERRPPFPCGIGVAVGAIGGQSARGGACGGEGELLARAATPFAEQSPLKGVRLLSPYGGYARDAKVLKKAPHFTSDLRKLKPYAARRFDRTVRVAGRPVAKNTLPSYRVHL